MPGARDEGDGGGPTTTSVRSYGVALRDGDVLLVRASARTDAPRIWWLPGGGIDPGESPEEALEREVLEETGLVATVGELVTVTSDVRRRHSGDVVHSVRIIYRIEVPADPLRHERSGSSDLARWVPLGELGVLNVADYARRAIEIAQTK